MINKIILAGFLVLIAIGIGMGVSVFKYLSMIENKYTCQREEDTNYYFDLLYDDYDLYKLTKNTMHLQSIEGTQKKMHTDGYSYAEIGRIYQKVITKVVKNHKHMQKFEKENVDVFAKCRKEVS